MIRGAALWLGPLALVVTPLGATFADPDGGLLLCGNLPPAIAAQIAAELAAALGQPEPAPTPDRDGWPHCAMACHSSEQRRKNSGL